MAVAAGRPPAADIFTAVRVDFYHHVFFFQVVGLVDDFALWTGHKAVAPELDAVGLAGEGSGAQGLTRFTATIGRLLATA